MHVHIQSPWNFVESAFSLNAKRQIKELYAFLAMFSLALSLITVFEPVFFYQLGFSLSKIALYYALHYAVYVLLMPIGVKFAARFGYERSLVVSTPVLAIYFLLLANLPTRPELFWLALAVLAFHKSFYWPAYHATFMAYSTEGDRGTEQSWQRLIIYGIGIIGPLAGGVIIAWFGFPILFVLVAVTLMLAGVPLLRTREKQHARSMLYGEAWRVAARPSERRLRWAMIGWGEHLVYTVVWPIWLFIIFKSPEMLGLVVSVSIAIMTVWGFFIGELSDRKTPHQVLRWGSLGLAATYILRGLAGGPIVAMSADMVGRLGNASMEIPFLARLYKQGKRKGALKYSFTFEMLLAVVKTAMAIVLIAVFWYYPPMVAFTIAFALGGVSAFFYRAL
jgi:MFS family permease